MQCVISCITGNRYKTVYPAPIANHSYFFTNNKEIFDELENKGWVPIYYNIPIGNIWQSSMDSKYIKFLQFLKDDQFQGIFGIYRKIIYIDHKLYLKKEHIEKVNQLKEKPILVTRTPQFKDNVMHEFSIAINQKRYQKTQVELFNYIKKKVTREGYKQKSRICRTGLIFYHLNNEKVMEMITKIYDDVMAIPNPQCQIVWAMISQKYRQIIQEIEWKTLNIPWADPK